MQKSSSESLDFDTVQDSCGPSSHPDHNTNCSDTESVPSEQMIADRLLAALAGGDLEHLEHLRNSFVERSPRERKPQAERSAVVTMFPAQLSEDERLRKEEEALRAAERELELRRTEVQAARRKAEEEIQRKAAEAERRQAEAEALRRKIEEEQRLADLQAIRKNAEAAAKERARKEQE